MLSKVSLESEWREVKLIPLAPGLTQIWQCPVRTLAITISIFGSNWQDQKPTEWWDGSGSGLREDEKVWWLSWCCTEHDNMMKGRVSFLWPQLLPKSQNFDWQGHSRTFDSYDVKFGKPPQEWRFFEAPWLQVFAWKMQNWDGIHFEKAWWWPKELRGRVMSSYCFLVSKSYDFWWAKNIWEPRSFFNSPWQSVVEQSDVIGAVSSICLRLCEDPFSSVTCSQ